MNRLYQKFLFPAHRLFLGRNILPHFFATQSQQWLSRSALLDLQNQRLCRLLTHAIKNVPYYRQKFPRTGLPLNHTFGPKQLACLPVLTKTELRGNLDDLMASNFSRKDLVTRSTGGSTGVPTVFFYDRNSWDSRVAAKYAAFSWAGWDFGVRTGILAGSPIDRAVFGSMLGKLKSALFRELVLDTFDMRLSQRRRDIARLQRFRPRVLIGYTSACLALARQLLQDGSSLSIPSIIVSAEMLFPDHREIIERAFHGQVFNLYGSRETAAIGMECRFHTGFHTAINRYVVEILRDDTPVAFGEEGEIVITDLLNYGMPFIRYKIGDFGKFLNAECPCGRKLPLLELTQGRITDIIITSEGKQLPGEFFPHLFKEIAPYVEQFQIIQERIDELTVTIVPAPSYGPGQTEYLKTKIQDKVGPLVKIVFRLVETIPPEKSGKHRVTISKLDETALFRMEPS